MKFARYLQDTQTPEWKKAYIDYRGLKKLITQIKAERQQSSSSLRTFSTHRTGQSPRPQYGTFDRSPNSITNVGPSSSPPPLDPLPPPHIPVQAPPPQPLRAQSENIPPSHNSRGSTSSVPQTRLFPSLTFANLRRRPSSNKQTFKSPLFASPSIPLATLLPTLPVSERRFFDALDKELEKVEKFYKERERDALVRITALKEQLKELSDHRKLFHETYPTESNRFSAFLPLPNKALSLPPPTHLHAPHISLSHSHQGSGGGSGTHTPTSPQLNPDEYHHAKKRLKQAVLEFYRGLELLNNYRVLNLTGFRKALKKFEKVTGVPVQETYMREQVEVCAFANEQTLRSLLSSVEEMYAVNFENNDRKKAIDRLRASYKAKSHHTSTFISGVCIGLGIPALGAGIYQSYQPSTRLLIPQWGILLQIWSAFFVPVVFSCLVSLNLVAWVKKRINYIFIFELDVRRVIDARQFSVLPSFLFLTFSYAFFLSFSPTSSLASSSTSSNASTSFENSSKVAPTTWPLIWFCFALGLIMNPLPVLWARSRWWFVREVGKLLVSGIGRVEFADFWMGDQFCSLTYTLSSMYLFSCAYNHSFKGDIQHICNVSSPAPSFLPTSATLAKANSAKWLILWGLSSLPSFVRIVQCWKRWSDSGLNIHWINAGKYTSSILQYLLYYLWRHEGSKHSHVFAVWCLFAVINSSYTSTWDLTMDWSLLRPHAKHPFLRDELIYSNSVPLYYFAIISNIAIRFIWVIYIPPHGASPQLRSFIAATLEMLRRWQWNFYRVENEHIGNADQYRVTREVPLPYTLDDGDHDDDENEDTKSTKGGWGRKSGSISKRSVRLGEVSGEGGRTGLD